MKLGAQLYSLRDECDSPEKLKNCLSEVKKMGYDCVQLSGACAIDAHELKGYVDEIGIPITCTHRLFSEICEKTDWCIDYHKTIGCNVIGIGSMPVEYKTTYEGMISFVEKISEPIKKITDAGLTFAYHNHAYEYEMRGDVMLYDYIIEKLPDIHFIHDVYWSTYAGHSPEEYIRKFAAEGKINHVHFKDMKTAPKGPICACGEGVIDFKKLTDVCREVGVEYIYVEQDNAPEFGSLAEMAKSYEYLKNIVRGK